MFDFYIVQRYVPAMNTALIRSWIESNSPHGIVKLAAQAEISVGTITKILKDGHEPSLDIARKLAGVIGATMDEISRSPDAEAS